MGDLKSNAAHSNPSNDESHQPQASEKRTLLQKTNRYGESGAVTQSIVTVLNHENFESKDT